MLLFLVLLDARLYGFNAISIKQRTDAFKALLVQLNKEKKRKTKQQKEELLEVNKWLDSP